jgi:S1-C subfamily serine protease
MSYDIAKAMGSNVTYGWLVMTVSSSQSGLQGGTSKASIAGASVTIGGDIIISLNGTRIRGIDDLSTYLEENTIPGATVNVTVVRNNQVMNIAVTLGTRATAG